MPFPKKYLYHDPKLNKLHTMYRQTKTNKSRRDQYSTHFRYKRYIHSWRFGYIDLIDQTQQKSIVCPSGFTWGQGWGVLNKCWTGYKIAKNLEQSLEKMKSFAKKIQNIQYDLGLKSTDFSHIGLPGDILVLYDKPPKSRNHLQGQIGVEIENNREKEKKNRQNSVDWEGEQSEEDEDEEPKKEEVNTEEELQDIWLKDTITKD